MSARNSEFYVGYQPKAPVGLSRFLKIIIFTILLFCFLAGIAFFYGQNSFSASFFEFGNYRLYHGKIRLYPYPHLLVKRPGLAGKAFQISSYLLVAPFKFGAKKYVKKYANKFVSLKGSLIYRDNQTMIEIVPDSIQTLGNKDLSPQQPLAQIPKEKLGNITLKGEIVGSKCYLGVMNPANHKTHRSCAVRCISGGIPPLFIVRDTKNIHQHFLLVSSKSKAVNQEVLDLVAKPIQITGQVEKRGDMLILKADPKDYIVLEPVSKALWGLL